MADLLPALVSGVLQGALYGAIAVGLSLLFGVMRVINFAHGSLLMLGMYAAYFTATRLGVDPYLAIVPAAVALFGVGYLLAITMVTPLYRRERTFVVEPTSVLILTAGLWLILDSGALLVFGSEYRSVTSSLGSETLSVLGVTIPVSRLLAALGAVLLTVGLHFLLTRSSVGHAMRATAQNREAAALAGINIYRIYATTFGLSGAVTGAAGALLLPFFYVYPTVGFTFDVRAFVIVVLGGMGSIGGTFVAGLIMGVVEACFTVYTTATYAQAIFFVVFIAVLSVRPQGLFGRATAAS